MATDGKYASLLLITSSQKTAAQYARLLPADRFAPEFNVCSPREAPFVLKETTYDVIVIDESVPTELGKQLASETSAAGKAHVLLLTDAEGFESAAGDGEKRGFMTLQSPVDPSLLRQSLGMMAASSVRIHELESEAEKLRSKLDEVRVVDRAKLLLIQHLRMTEQAAHRFIEKNAMDQCVDKRTIAEKIIRTYQN